MPIIPLINHVQTNDGDNIALNDNSGYWVLMTYVISPYQSITYANDTVTDCTQTPLKSYLYYQYMQDPNLKAWVSSYNNMINEYLQWYSTINLSVYAGNPQVRGPILDWMANGLYGMQRPVLPSAMIAEKGVYNTEGFNSEEYNAFHARKVAQTYTTTDDIFKRIMTWNLHKGEGYNFNVPQLKRRIQRFLDGADGVDGTTESGEGTGPDQTYSVSIQFDPMTRRRVTIKVNTALGGYDYIWGILKAAISGGVCQMPMGYEWVLQ